MQEIIDRAYIKKLMNDLGVNQNEFARLVGCSFQTVSKWLNEGVKPGPHYVRHILELDKQRRKSSHGN